MDLPALRSRTELPLHTGLLALPTPMERLILLVFITMLLPMGPLVLLELLALRFHMEALVHMELLAPPRMPP